MVHNAAVTTTSSTVTSVELRPTRTVRAATAIVLVPAAMGAAVGAAFMATQTLAGAVTSVGIAMALAFFVTAVVRARLVADGDDITVRSTFATTVHRWSDIDDVYLLDRDERAVDLLARTSDGRLVSLVPAALRDPSARGGAQLKRVHERLLELGHPLLAEPQVVHVPDHSSEARAHPLELRYIGWRRAAGIMLGLTLGTIGVAIPLASAGHGLAAAMLVIALVASIVRSERATPTHNGVLLRIDDAGISWWARRERTIAWPDIESVDVAPGWRRHVVVLRTGHAAHLVPTWRYDPDDVVEAIASWSNVTVPAPRRE